MRYRITLPEVQWGQRKVAMMRQDIIRWLAGNGAAGATWEEITDGEAAKDEPPRFLHLQCKPCGVHWYWESFRPCPSCQQKAGVHKVEFGRVHLPEGVALGQTTPREAA